MLKRLPGTLILLLSLSLSWQINAQEVEVGLQVGYATFNMKDLKDLQKEISGFYFPINTKIGESFPGYINFSGNINLVFDRYYYGLVFGHTSTGGRVSYSDYSGSLTADLLIRMNYLGGTYARKINNSEKFDLFAKGEMLLWFDDMTFIEEWTTANEFTSSTQRFKTVNLGLGFYLEAQKRINKFLIKGNMGGEIQVPGEVKFVGEDNTYLVDLNGENVKIQGGGFRINLGIAYLFERKAPSSPYGNRRSPLKKNSLTCRALK